LKNKKREEKRNTAVLLIPAYIVKFAMKKKGKGKKRGPKEKERGLSTKNPPTYIEGQARRKGGGRSPLEKERAGRKRGKRGKERKLAQQGLGPPCISPYTKKKSGERKKKKRKKGAIQALSLILFFRSRCGKRPPLAQRKKKKTRKEKKGRRCILVGLVPVLS